MCVSAEIEQTLYRLAWGTDLRDVALIEDSYTEDVRWVRRDPDGAEKVLDGREAVMAHLAGSWSKGPRPNAHHLISNVLVRTSTADTAEVTSYKTVVRVDGATLSVVSSAWYEDSMIKQIDGWRISARVLNPDH